MSRLTVPVTSRDHLQGRAEAPALLVEYGDYECPHCAAAQPMLDALLRSLPDRLGLVYRHFPITTVHPHAQDAAEAAEAADAQGAFWPMHRVLFEQQQALERVSLIEYASELGLDVALFERELRLHRHARRVREDFMGGVRSGVNGTPAFFINGWRYDGPHDAVSMLDAVEQVMAEKTR